MPVWRGSRIDTARDGAATEGDNVVASSQAPDDYPQTIYGLITPVRRAAT